jgi:hypothetical protein
MSEKITNGFEALLTQANECLNRAGEALNLAVEGMPPTGDFQRKYIRQQAASVASVVLDVNLLVSHEHFENVVGLCRIGFESRINLYAAMQVPEFAAQKFLAGVKGNIEELEEMIKGGAATPLSQRELVNHKKLLADMRCDLGGIEEKPWCKFKEVVKASGLTREYEAHYPTMSKAVHNTLTGLATKNDARILIYSVLNLLNDVVETCAALVFFQTPGERSPQPLTTRWKEVVDQIPIFQDECGSLVKTFSDLTNETFRHPEN